MKRLDEIAHHALAGDTTSVNLFREVNPFYREFTDSITLTAKAQAVSIKGL